jgi:hypothetical protein
MMRSYLVLVGAYTVVRQALPKLEYVVAASTYSLQHAYRKAKPMEGGKTHWRAPAARPKTC